MVEGHKCDRCGEFEPAKNVPNDVNHSITFGYESLSGGKLKTSTNSYDLCNGCRTGLVNWVEVDNE